jgi:flagellar biosynthesis protein FlhF
MNIKKFTGENMKAAMAKVKAEFGDDAIILHTKSTSRKGLRGLLSSPDVEITAGISTLPAPNGSVPPSGVSARTIAAERFGQASLTDSVECLAGRIGELESLLEETLRENRPTTPHARIPKGWMTVEKALTARGFSPETVEAVILEASQGLEGGKPEERTARLRTVLEGQFHVGGPVRLQKGKETVAVFIGATGVGKTTTLAKIGANYCREGRKVGFLTADTYRMAAVDQLRCYAEILQTPLEVVYSPEEVSAAMERLSGLDLVLVDTAGRSQYDEKQMRDLASIIESLPGAEVSLLLQATSLKESQIGQIEHFGKLGADRLIYTKVDELPWGAPIIELARLSSIPVAYVTDGQEVPDDIWVADPTRLARLALTVGADRAKGAAA